MKLDTKPTPSHVRGKVYIIARYFVEIHIGMPLHMPSLVEDQSNADSAQAT